MKRIATAFAARQSGLGDYLALVLTLHLFVEQLLDRWIERHSTLAGQILCDRRAHPFAVKLTLVFHMGGVPLGLFRNLRALDRLREDYVRDVDVDLAERFDQGFTNRRGEPLFPDARGARFAIRSDPHSAGLRVLRAIATETFGRLCELLGEAGGSG